MCQNYEKKGMQRGTRLHYPLQVLQYFASTDTAAQLSFLGSSVQLCDKTLQEVSLKEFGFDSNLQ